MEKTILIIDDDVDYQYMLGSMLRKCGYQVKTLLEGKLKAAVTIASKCDIVLVDFELPGSNGVDVSKELRTSPETSNIPVIMVSSHNEDDNNMFTQSRATAYIQKPFSISVLLNKIKELLKNQIVT